MARGAFTLDHDPHVTAWVKNDHLGFDVHYVFQGAVLKYRPDFMIRLTNGLILSLEVNGQDSEKDRTERQALAEWVEGVNAHGGFGRWASDVSFWTADVGDILGRHGRASAATVGAAPRHPRHLRTTLGVPRGPSSSPIRPYRNHATRMSHVRGAATGSGPGAGRTGKHQPRNHAADERGSSPRAPGRCFRQFCRM